MQNYINHIALVLDESSSMTHRSKDLIRVADGQIAYLAQRSKELDQETRVTVYVFSNKARCVVYDKDVLRLPSISQYYRPGGMTALVDATVLALDDLALQPEKYGDHAFLIFVLTDGQENCSKKPTALEAKLRALPDHWTVAALVPDQLSKYEAKRFGFGADNVAIWDPNTARGVQEVGQTIRRATDTFMEGRTRGVRGSRNVFSTGSDVVNASSIADAALVPVPSDEYMLIPVHQEGPIREWVQDCGYEYRVGKAFYQLTKSEIIQTNKAIAVVERASGKVYTGPQARDIIGLGDVNVRVRPNANLYYDIFVQSTSVNRKLIVGTKLLLFTT